MPTERKPKSLNEIWSEKHLCEQLDLPVPERDDKGKRKSRILSGWIRDGLKFFKVSERRYFFEQAVIEYLWSRGH